MSDLVSTAKDSVFSFQQEIMSILDGSASVEKIESQPQYENAALLTKEIKRLGKNIEDKRKELVGPLNAEVKTINDLFKEPTTRLDSIERNLKTVMLGYQKEQEAIRIEAQRKADEEARKQREEIERQARAQREKEESARRAEAEAMRKAQEAATEQERSKALAEAQRAAKAAETAAEKATAKEQISDMIVAPLVQTMAQKPAGMATVTTWSAEITDKAEFIKYCLSSNQLHFLNIDIQAVSRVIQATKGNMLFPGVKATKTESIRMRA